MHQERWSRRLSLAFDVVLDASHSLPLGLVVRVGTRSAGIVRVTRRGALTHPRGHISYHIDAGLGVLSAAV